MSMSLTDLSAFDRQEIQGPTSTKPLLIRGRTECLQEKSYEQL
jgi:hypothetical protein